MTKLLIVEDEESLREEVLEWLSFEGYEVNGAGDGLEGIELALQESPDLIVCDIMMPRLDGYGTLLELRSNPVTATIPFIFLTARADREAVRYGMGLGADDYLTKPFTRKELFEAIEVRLSKRAIQQQEHQAQVTYLNEALDQEREQRMVKTQMVSMFSHDFRNSLAAILSSNSLLRDYSERMSPERRTSHMNQIEASVRLLLQMLDELLIVGQIETGNLVAHPEQFDMIQFLQSIIKEFRLIDSEAHPITLEYERDVRVILDKNLFRQIMSNLLSNALKYSKAGSEVNVQLEQNGQDIILVVHDNGIGIPEAELVKLFEAFYRASNVEEIQGNGLGLAILKRAVELQHGTVHVESHVNAGTTFTVILPCEPKGD